MFYRAAFALLHMTPLIAAIGCSSSQPPPPPNPLSPAPEAEPAPSPEQAIIQQAEAFVRRHGYTEADVPPPEDLRREMTDPQAIKQIMEARRGTIEPQAVGAVQEGQGWLVGFRYREPLSPDRGRALRMQPDQPPHFVHQDILLAMFSTDATQ